MDARKAAAAVSAAGFIVIAGCGGGGKISSSLPSTTGGLHNNTAPANSSRVSFEFAIPARMAPVWTTPAVQPAYKQRRAKAFTPKRVTQTFVRRKPQYLSPGLLGGSIYVSIYQGANLALTQGPFTAGFSYGATDFYCAYSAALAQYECTNYSAVFAPYGNDTFYVSTYNASNQLLSVTPGMPGTSFVSATQPSYDVTSSGYPGPILVSTYAVASTLAMDAPTSCVDPSGSPLVAEAFLADASGYPISGNLANPVTIGLTGNFTLYNLYAQQVTTPYTVSQTYGAFSAFEFVAAASGATSAVSVSSTAGAVGINLTSSTTRNLYAVDRLALSPSTSGIDVVGLVDSGPTVFDCGALPMANYATGYPFASFSNPVAIGEDDYIPGVAVLDNVSGSPYLDLVDLNRYEFGDFLETGGIINAVPVVPVQAPGHNPLALAVSPSDAVGSGNIYILNADGSIQVVNDNYAPSVTVATLYAAGTVSGPVDIAVSWNTGGDGDYVFATSSNSANLYDIWTANSSPSLNPVYLGLDGVEINGTQFTSPETYAISADNVSGEQYVFFTAFDSGNSGTVSIASCEFFFCGGEVGNTGFVYNISLAQGETSLNFSNGTLTFLTANGSSVSAFTGSNFPATPTSAPFPAFGGPVTQIITSYDGIWNGIDASSTFQFFYNFGGTSAGALAGTHAAIVSPFTVQP